MLLELYVPVLAIVGLQQFLKTEEKQRKKYLLHTLYICLGLMGVLLLAKGFLDFQGANDGYYANQQIVQAIVESNF